MKIIKYKSFNKTESWVEWDRVSSSSDWSEQWMIDMKHLLRWQFKKKKKKKKGLEYDHFYVGSSLTHFNN